MFLSTSAGGGGDSGGLARPSIFGQGSRQGSGVVRPSFAGQQQQLPFPALNGQGAAEAMFMASDDVSSVATGRASEFGELPRLSSGCAWSGEGVAELRIVPVLFSLGELLSLQSRH